VNIDEAIHSAIEHCQRGDLEESENLCRKILTIQPSNAQALHLLGVICYLYQKYDAAIKLFKESISFDPSYAEAYYNCGNVFKDKEQFDEAVIFYKKALQFDPHNACVLVNLGYVLGAKGNLDDAIKCYQEALKLTPDNAIVHFHLGNALFDKGLFDEAIQYYRKTIAMNPDNADAYNYLGVIFRDKGLLDEAIQYHQKAIAVNPNDADAYLNLGNAFKDIGKVEEAIDNYKKALHLNPNFADAYLNLGIVWHEEGKWKKAISLLDMSLHNKPDYMKALWARCISHLPIIFQTQSDIQISRNLYCNELVKLQRTIPLKTQQDIENAAGAVGSLQPFYLAYQGLNDKELQQIYGRLICRIMSLRYPRFADHLDMPPSSGKQLRIGFVSGFFTQHSNWKIPIKGWIENIDKQRFRLYGYYTGKKKDMTTADAKQSFTRFVEDIHSFEELCKTIRGDNLHILIYPEVGMDPTAVRLASLRLAPIQCTSWGHPDTSGLPSIDYFLSSDLMEPSDAEEHYTEKLIRLPNLSVYYTPLHVPHAAANRETFGLRKNAALYLCCQALFKYLPQYDEIYPRIAAGVGDCQFLFISHKSSAVTEQFQQRMRKSFDMFGMSIDDYTVFLPHLDTGLYNAINSLADIYLDSIGWSGCNSTFEAITHNLPIVTVPGEFMRGRHSAAILKMMGITETIASTLDEYIELAVRLGSDAGFRKQLSDKIVANKHLLYRDKACIRALEDFFERVVREKFP